MSARSVATSSKSVRAQWQGVVPVGRLSHRPAVGACDPNSAIRRQPWSVISKLFTGLPAPRVSGSHRSASRLQTGYAAGQCDAGHKPAHTPSPRTIAATGCAHGLGRGAAGEQVELAFLDPVFHLAACAINLLVEVTGLMLAAS